MGPRCPGGGKRWGRQDVKSGWVRSAISHAELDQDVLGRLLGVLNKNVKVAIVIEDTCIEQFIFHVATVTMPIVLDQIPVWISGLRVLVQVLHIGMRGCAVEVE